MIVCIFVGDGFIASVDSIVSWPGWEQPMKLRLMTISNNRINTNCLFTRLSLYLFFAVTPASQKDPGKLPGLARRPLVPGEIHSRSGCCPREMLL